MNDIISKLLSLLESHPKYSKFIGFVLVILAALYTVLQFTSCSTITPAIQDNKLAAEGVVSKEKNVSRTTRWFYKPENDTLSNP